MIEVVSAVMVTDSGRIILTQRNPNKDFPFMWECPGGKVDGNESHHEALRRELREELDVDADIPAGQQSIWCGEFDHPVGRIFLLMYPVYYVVGSLSPREKQGIGWFTADEMMGLTLTPGNMAALEAIVAHMRRRTRREVP